MRDVGSQFEGEGFNFQQGLNAALSGAGQGAATGTSVVPGWGTLIGALAGAGMGLASQAMAPSTPPPRAAPPAPRAPPAPPIAVPPPAIPAASPPVLGSPPAPMPEAPTPVPSAPTGAGGVLGLLQNPQVMQLLTSLLASQRQASSATPGRPPASLSESEAAEEAGALNWLVANRIARLG